MPHITSIERLSREEGQREGWQEGRQEDIIEALAACFGEVPADLRLQIKAVADETRLKGLLRQAVVQPTLETFRAHCQGDLV